jgi:integrase
MTTQSVTAHAIDANVIQSESRNSRNRGDLAAVKNVSHTVGTPKRKRAVSSGRSRGQIIRRGDKKWLVRAYTGTSPKGKREYSSKIVRGTHAQSKQALTELLREVDTDQHIAPSKQTLREFLTAWLTNTAPLRVSASTVIGYRSTLIRVLDTLGSERLDKLTPQMIQRLYSKMDDDELSSRTIEAVHTVLKMALEQAVTWRLIVRNPTRGAERPAKVKSQVAQAFNAEEVDLFLEAAKKDANHALWLAFVTTGLRPQEMFALKWTDIMHRNVRVQRDGAYVDVPTTVLNVQRAMKHVGKGRYEVSTTMKTKKSKRTVAIPASLVETLSAHKRTQAEQILAAGESYERSGYIFANRVGRPLDVNNVRDLFHAMCVQAKVRKVRLYDLRHTHATLLLSAGVHLKIVSERLGHSSIMLTGDTYSHVLPEVEHETALTVEAMLRKPNRPQTPAPSEQALQA